MKYKSILWYLAFYSRLLFVGFILYLIVYSIKTGETTFTPKIGWIFLILFIVTVPFSAWANRIRLNEIKRRQEDESTKSLK